MAIIPHVIEQHAEEVAFLWVLRDDAVRAPHYSLADLAKLDNRIDAHLDGLRIAGGNGWEICKEALARQEAGEVFAAAVLAFESEANDRIDLVLEAGSASPELSRALVSALGWFPYRKVEKHIQRVLNSESPALLRVGIAACAVHRHDPAPFPDRAFLHPDALLRARSLRAAGELKRIDLLPTIRVSLNQEDRGCRFGAAWSAVLLGDADATAVLRELAEQGGIRSGEACALALRRMQMTDAHAWRESLAERPDTLRIAVSGAGVVGDPALIPWLIQMMKTPELARVSGESFTMITGVDIAYEDLEGEWPEGFEAGPTERPEDEEVEMDPDEDLPWPAPELIAAWWSKNKGSFRNGTRHLLGKPIVPENLKQILSKGFQRQRAAAAIELVLLDPGEMLFEVRAPGFFQQQILGLKREATSKAG